MLEPRVQRKNKIYRNAAPTGTIRLTQRDPHSIDAKRRGTSEDLGGGASCRPKVGKTDGGGGRISRVWRHAFRATPPAPPLCASAAYCSTVVLLRHRLLLLLLHLLHRLLLHRSGGGVAGAVHVRGERPREHCNLSVHGEFSHFRPRILLSVHSPIFSVVFYDGVNFSEVFYEDCDL